MQSGQHKVGNNLGGIDAHKSGLCQEKGIIQCRKMPLPITFYLGFSIPFDINKNILQNLISSSVMIISQHVISTKTILH